MGFEYRISCPPENLPKLVEFLRRFGGQPGKLPPGCLEFRFQPSGPDEMPNAIVQVEAEGLYFCDYGGSRESVAVLFRRIIDEALDLSGSSDSITVSRL